LNIGCDSRSGPPILMTEMPNIKFNMFDIEFDGNNYDNEFCRDVLSDSIIISKIQDQEFSKKFYGSLCNTDWYKGDSNNPISKFSCSWRYAGGFVASIRGNRDFFNHMDLYCCGTEGEDFEEVNVELNRLGWKKCNIIPLTGF